MRPVRHDLPRNVSKSSSKALCHEMIIVIDVRVMLSNSLIWYLDSTRNSIPMFNMELSQIHIEYLYVKYSSG